MEHVDFVVNFILLSAKDYLLNPSLLEEVNVLLSVINPVALQRAESNYLSEEVRTLTDLLFALNRITISEQGQFERRFITFVAAYRISMSLSDLDSVRSSANILRACTIGASTRLIRNLLYLGVTGHSLLKLTELM